VGYDIEFISLNTGFVAGQSSIYQTTNAGASWNYLVTSSSLFDAGVYHAITFQNSLQGCAVGYNPYYGQAELMMTYDGGTSWNPFFFGNGNSIFQDVCFTSAQTGYVVGNEGDILKTNNNGNSWQQLSSSTTADIYSVDFVNSTVGFAGGDQILLKTTDAGVTWQNIPGNWTSITKLEFVDALRGYMIDNGVIYRTNDGGATWNWASHNNFHYTDLFFQNSDTGYAITQSFTAITKTLDGGGYWSVETADTTNMALLSVTFVDDTTGYITGSGGVILKTTNAGGNSFFPYDDAGITSFYTTDDCSDTQNVYVVIKNYGLDTLYNATINWFVNSTMQIPYSWSGALSRMDSDTLIIGTYIFTQGNSIISGYTDLPNNVSDSRTINDSNSDTLSFRLCIPHDAAMAALKNQFQICSGIHDVYVILRNDGDSILTSAIIECKIGSTLLPPAAWTGVILPGDTSGLILAGTYNFILNQTYAVKAWTSLPNNHIDDRPANDTITTSIIVKGLHGTYTIGGSSPDYPDFTAAVADLTVSGICDTVIFNVRPGTYIENIVIPSITQANQFIPVVFQSEQNDSAGVTLRFNTSGPFSLSTVRYNHASFITFRALTVESITSNKHVVFITDSSSHNTFSHCRFIAPTGTSSGVYLLYAANGSPPPTPLHYTQVENCLFKNGQYGVNIISSDSLNPTKGLVIKNNVFENQYISSIQALFAESPVIENNTINCIYVTTAIKVQYGYDNIRISKNSFYGGCRYGIFIDECRARNNTHINVLNNMISYSSTWTYAYGISLQYISGISVCNNSVLNSTTGANYIPIFATGCHDLSLRNNIAQNSGGGPAMRINSSTASSDYNNLFTTGSILAKYGSLNYNTLTAIQVGTGNEMNSISVSTQFISLTDLHLASWSGGMDSLGIPLAVITDDIDGDLRDPNFPDIGADEYSPIVITEIPITAVPDQILVFPNPASQSVTISFAPAIDGNTVLNIYNVQGLLVISEPVTEQQNLMLLDVSILSSGLYFIEMHNNAGSLLTKKIIIEKN
jgi:photosystem II stability/assembly factor-like uncharacterized protein